MASNQVGKTVQYNGHVFERIRVLGKGSFGTAIVHKRQHDCALVVLKEIDLVELKRDADKLAAIQEAQIMSRLSHQNIIKYFNAYTTDTKLIIEMEYARLGTLQTYLSYQNRPLEELEIFQIFRQILFGLDYLHSKSIVHLDLKMANIFVTSEGSIKIGDFGIAKFISPSSSGGDRGHVVVESHEPKLKQVPPVGSHRTGAKNSHNYQLGTLAYSSPERCLGESTDFKSDIWSLGCILYELATLRPLFASESLPELVLHITRVHYEPIQRADIRPAFKSLLEQMISRQPGDRPSAGELISSTDQLLLQLELTKTARCQQKTILNRLPVNNNHNVFGGGHRQQARQRNLADLSTEGAALPLQHSLLYQVRLSSHDIQVDRVNLPQSKRIRELAKGRSHYLVLTYDDIVYGWGTKHHGQLGVCNLFSVNQPGQPRSPSLAGANQLRHTRSARNSLTARDLQLLSPSFSSAATTDHRHMSRAPPTPNRDRKLPASLTQPPSLSSSTQTILAPNHNDHSGSSASLLASSNQQQDQRSRGQHQFEMLFAAQPATRPIVVSELNKRKICRVAAGNDFSVFLSKTGIVLTCGDGSRGCLGRGSLASSFTPCMVDGLLNMDVVSIASGPEHVVAVCSNGQAFTWGNSRHGRLGLSPERLQSGATGSHSRGSDYVVRPQLVDFKLAQPLSGLSKATSTSMSNQVFIKSAFCGDRCTIFIDSNYQCWACGQNRSNKLGMDRTRRFKRTILVQGSWLPVRISALAKERIVTCSIGRDHASYLTSEGKMIVFGQDIDHSYRLRMNLNAGSDRVPPLNSWTNSHRASQLSLTSNHPNIRLHLPQPQARVRDVMNEFDHESLIDLLLANNRLKNFKIPERDHKPPSRSIETSRFARKQVSMYLKMTRASKKMPFDEVVGISCTSKFSLALTNDNRIYFWGTRTHEMDDYGKTLSSLKCPPMRQARPRAPSIEPQLVAGCSDECFIKIGATNSSLMSTIQLLGSDQPIILARNPKLTAKSLADLWILDYEPPPPGTDERLDQSSLNSSLSSSLCSLSLSPSGLSSASCATLASDKSDRGGRRSSSQCSDSQCSELGPVGTGWRGAANSRQCCTPESKLDDHEAGWSGQLVDHKRHDAILEPQPIVSLYVPSMFNHSGCALQLVNLFCFDEDRFFIVLDTTVKFQQPASFAPASSAPIPIGTKTQAHSSRRKSYCSFKTHHNQTGVLVEHHQPHTAASQSARTRLNMVEELRSGGSSSQEQRNPRRNSAGMEKLSGNNESAPAQASDELCPRDLSSSEKQECCRDIKADLIESHHHVIYPTETAKVVEDAADDLSEPDGMALVSQQISPVSHNCLSLEEPRSMSTFAPGFDGNHLAIVGPATPRDDDCESLRRLSFERSQQLWNYEPSSGAAAQHLRQQTRNGHHQRKHRRRLTGRARNRSESTVVTGGYEDDTSSMPTWVKNEYIQQMQCAQPIVGRQDGEPSSEDEETTCVSEVTLTDANSGLQSSSTSLEGRTRLNTSDDDYDEREEEEERTTELGWHHQVNSRDSSPGCRIGTMRRASNPATESTCTGASTVLSQHLSRSQPDVKESVSRLPRDINLDLGGDRAYGKLISENLLDCRVYRSVSVSSKQSAISEDCEGRLGSGLKTNEHGPMSASFGSEISQQDQLATSCHQLETYQPEGTTQLPSTAEEMDSRSRPRAGSLVDQRGVVPQQPIDRVSISERTSNGASPRERTVVSNSKNSNGLKKNVLSQSAYLDTGFNGHLSRELQADLNNNPIGRRPITRSRSSLSSIRKSLVRIFC